MTSFHFLQMKYSHHVGELNHTNSSKIQPQFLLLSASMMHFSISHDFIALLMIFSEQWEFNLCPLFSPNEWSNPPLLYSLCLDSLDRLVSYSVTSIPQCFSFFGMILVSYNNLNGFPTSNLSLNQYFVVLPKGTFNIVHSLNGSVFYSLPATPTYLYFTSFICCSPSNESAPTLALTSSLLFQKP